MKKKGKIVRNIGIVIFSIYVIPMVFGFYAMEFHPIFALLLGFIVAFFMALMIVLWIKMIIFVFTEPIKKVNKVRRLQDAKYVESSDYKYVRNIPNNYSPALASLILDQSIESNKDVIATTLYLINHGYLKEQEGKIVVTNKDNRNLMSHELYLIGIYEKKSAFSPIKWRDNIISDANNENLIEKRHTLDTNDKIKLAANLILPILVVITLFNLIMWLMSLENIILFIPSLLIMMAFPMIVLSVVIYDFFYFASYISKDIKLTKTGLREQENMAKFKNFLQDFSNIQKRNTEEVILWEDYLTFAVALDVNKQVYWDEKFRNKIKATSNTIQFEFINELSKLGS
jgi:hypothetical protein